MTTFFGRPENLLWIPYACAPGYTPEPFDVRITSNGATLHVPADTSRLEVLRQNGVEMPWPCEIGVCGSCKCSYREGDVLHRDVVLPRAGRQDHLMPCVSRARGTLTLGF